MIRVLAINGGGVRGLLAAEILLHLEDAIRRKTNGDARLCEHFDIITGTSTGGIIAAALALRVDALSLVHLYQDRAKAIFRRSWLDRLRNPLSIFDPTYSPDGLRRELVDVLGDAWLRSTVTRVVLPAWEISRGQIHLFDSELAKRGIASDFLLVDACMGTSAAPTYFPPHRCFNARRERFDLWDGGLFENSPVGLGYVTARSLPGNPTAKDILLVNVGTGRVVPHFDPDVLRSGGRAKLARPLVSVAMAAQAAKDRRQIRALYDAADVPELFVSIDPDLAGWFHGVEEMDNTDPANLHHLRVIGQDAAAQAAYDIERVASVVTGVA